jgi:hypothetical protein
MTNKELAELLKYSSPKELLIVTWNNLLKRLFCPFNVLVRHDIGELKRGEIVWVQGIKVTNKLITVYIINGRAYYYYHFEIIDPP